MTTGRDGCADSGRRSREAVEWYELHRSRKRMSGGAIKKWRRWAADPANDAEYDEIVRLRSLLRTLPPPTMPSAAELRADSVEPEFVPRIRDGLRAGSRPLWFAVCLGAAALAAYAIIPILPRLYAVPDVPPALTLEYRTAIGEHRRIPLSDGSVMTLGGATVVKATLSAKERDFVLESGEALFEVTQNPSRPFRVAAGTGSITALGTAFDVLRYSTSVVVSVTEGSVAVDSRDPRSTADGASSAPGARLKSARVMDGQAVSYDERGDASAVRRIDSKAAIAWRQGLLSYRGRALREVVEDAQRYSTLRLVVDPSAAELQYTGDISAVGIEHWVYGLSKIFPVEVDDSNPARLVIRRHNSAARTPN